MRLLHSASRTQASFDDPNLVSCAGLVAVLRLAQACGLAGLVAGMVRIGTSVGSNLAGKITTIIAGMITGADSIEDLDVVPHGGMGRVFGGVYAPSTLVSFLREFRFGHVRELVPLARTPDLMGTTATGKDVDVPAPHPC